MYRRKASTFIIEKKIFWGLVTAICTLMALYGFFVSTSIVNVIVREEIEQEIAATNARISELEFDYIHKKNAINLEYAHAMGFNSPVAQTFVARRSTLSSRLSLSDEI